MSGFLHVRIGRLGVLLPVAGVLEILELDQARVTSGHAPWRSTSLPVQEGRVLLGEALAATEASVGSEPTTPRPAIVYSPAPESWPSMLLVDGIAGLLPAVHPTALHRAPARMLHLVAGTAPGAAGERLYCLRYPLSRLGTDEPAN